MGRIGLCVVFAKIYQIIQGSRSAKLRFSEVMEELKKFGDDFELTDDIKVIISYFIPINNSNFY